MTNIQNKPVMSTTPSEITQATVNFDKGKFDALVEGKGYRVFVDSSLVCPCKVKGTGAPLPDCKNCLGKGWFFVNRKETTLVVQGMKADVKYENWSQVTAGFAKVTARAKDRLAFMDRIILQDAEGIFQETLIPIVVGGDIVAYPNYFILEIENIYRFDTSNTALVPLVETTDYTVSGNKIIFNNSLLSILNAPGGLSITVRYIHNLTYFVVDMNRDVFKTKISKCKEGDVLGEMPVSGTIRKAHYVFDNLTLKETTLIENSTTPP